MAVAPAIFKKSRLVFVILASFGLFNIDGLVKSPSAALRFTFVVAAYLVSTPLSSAFARLVRLRRRAFYFAIPILTFYEIINIDQEIKKFIKPN
jgi:hypothetical protein